MIAPALSLQNIECRIPIQNLWYMLVYAWDDLFQNRTRCIEEVEDAPSIDALFALILTKLLQQRMRIGLGRNYQDERLNLRGLRGRINFNECIKKQSFSQGYAICDAQQFSLNVPKNQIIRSTLVRLIQTGQFGPDANKGNELRHNLRLLSRTMDGVDLIEITPSVIRRQQFGRNDRDYQLMMVICELIWLRQMPTSTTGDNYLPSIDRDLVVLHRIYERFVANFYRSTLKDWKVTPQSIFSWFDSTANSNLPAMKPDLLFVNKSSGKIIVLDTKFTASSLSTGQWGNRVFDSGNLYQIYTYVKTQEHVSENHRQSTGILLYPAVTQLGLSEEIKLQDHRIRIQTIDLSAPWMDIEKGLLDIIQNN
jgi:5-methylcytosine-specific restriction enzyme subunit McrC